MKILLGRFSGRFLLQGCLQYSGYRTQATRLDAAAEQISNPLMPKNVYSEINLHITWHTKNNNPVLVDSIENRTHHYLEKEIRKMKGAQFHAVGGVDNHVHVAATVSPTILIGEWIGRLKGGSSFYINHEIANRSVLHWQTGYGVVSFGTKDLQWVIDYIQNQKEHHRKGTTIKRLEVTGDEEEKGR